MLYFLLGAALGLLVVTVWQRLAKEGSLQGAQRLWRGSPRWLRLLALLNLVAWALILLRAHGAWLIHLGETASGFRVVLGLLFGAVLALAERGEAQAQPETGGPSAERTTDKSRPAPWWTHRRALLPLGLIALPLLALLAPRGELNLDFVQSVKTPFIEAYFARNETDLRLQLQSEPEGFFRLSGAGLEEAIHLAHAEVLYRETVPGTVDRPDAQASKDRQLGDARDALGLIENVLQPISQCIHQIDALYNDRELLRDSLHYVGSRLARALLVVDKSADRFQDRARRSTAEGGIDLSLSDLGSQIAADRNLIALINGNDKSSYCGAGTSDGDSEEEQDSLETAIRSYDEDYLASPAKLVALLGQPAVVHASAMFFMWSGNPSAAKKMLAHVCRSAKACDDPGISFLRGFTTRWEGGALGTANPQDYLDYWQTSIESLEDRRDALARRAFSSSPQDGDITPTDEADPECCAACLAYRFYTWLEYKVRNHLAFESARELMTRRTFRDRDAVLEMAKHHASILEQAVAENELEKADLQMLEAVCAGGDPDDEEGRRRMQLITWIGEKRPADDYALFLDSAGLVRLVDAVAKDDDAGVEQALALFEESLLQGEGDLDAGIALTIREHRDQARRALGLPDF